MTYGGEGEDCMPGAMLIQQLIPAIGWCGLYAKRRDTGELHLWTKPLVAWALVQQDCSEDAKGEDIERNVVGMVAWEIDGVMFCQDTKGFVLIYVQEGEDLEPYRDRAEMIIG